jgi:prepilin-type N-terminal cleavage/methylation domain-containing protein/prepilin-type processing-associated H-X9-DG protein
MNRTSARCRGFSLTELLVVVSVMLILVAILVVGVDLVYSQAMQTKCQHNLEQIGYALRVYSLQNNSKLPEPKSLGTGRLWYEALAKTSLDNLAVLGCPSVGDPPKILDRDGYAPENREEVVEAYHKALYWLKEQQAADGHIPPKAGYRSCHVAVTAMALMGFFGLGCNDRYPEQFARTIRDAVEYICSDIARNSNGQFYKHPYHSKYRYGSSTGIQGITVTALAIAYRCLEDEGLRAKVRNTAQIGLNWLADHTSPTGNYEYEAYATPTQGVITHAIWAYQAVGESRRAGFTIPPNLDAAMENILAQNAAGNGDMRKRWLADGPTTAYGTGYSWIKWKGAGDPLLTRTILGDEDGPVTQELVGATAINTSNQVAGIERYHAHHVTRGLRIAGGSKWDAWREVYPEYMIQHLTDEGYDSEGNAMGSWRSKHYGGGSMNIVGSVNVDTRGTAFITSLTLIMLGAAFEDNWLEDDYEPVGDGECSYGYNSLLGRDGGTVAADTILVLDYGSWIAHRGREDPEENDGDELIQLRHSGKANALMGDGSVRPVDLDSLKPGMWTPQAAD